VISLTILGTVLVGAALIFDYANWYKQITKVLRMKHSSQISTSALMAKVGHYLCSTVSLAIFANWVGLAMEGSALICCLATLALVAKYKPKGWKLIDVKFDVKKKRRKWFK
jgi:hypothetical protein